MTAVVSHLEVQYSLFSRLAPFILATGCATIYPDQPLICDIQPEAVSKK